MESLPGAISASARARILSTWIEALHASVPAVPHEATFVERADFDAIVAVEIDGMLLVCAPPAALDIVRRARRETLLDAEAVARLFPGVADPIGTADLLFTERRPRRGDHVATAAEVADVTAVRGDVSAAEWEESGVGEMGRRWVVTASDGQPAAIAGFEPWRSEIAQLGIVSATHNRRAGYAYSVAAAAAGAALDAGLIAQWRSRQGNGPSLQLARRLGFVQLGVQAAVALNG